MTAWGLVAAGLICATRAPAAEISSFVPGAPADEAAIRAILLDQTQMADSHRAADLDWENAFGIRYHDLGKQDAFYAANVTPLQAASIEQRLEVKVRFVTATIAVADVYKRRIGQLDLATRKPGPDRWIRATVLLEKRNDVWVDVLERVADLRLPYYVHYETIPIAFPLPPQNLKDLAGSYSDGDGRPFAAVSVVGDYLVMKTAQRAFTVVPTSASTFLSFDPNDLAGYDKITLTKDAAGRATLSMTDMVDTPLKILSKAP